MIDTELETKSMNRILPSRMVNKSNSTNAIANASTNVITNNTLDIVFFIIFTRFVVGGPLVGWLTLPTSC